MIAPTKGKSCITTVSVCNWNYLLIVIVKKWLQIDASLYTLLQILSVFVIEKNQLLQVLQGVVYISEQCNSANQLKLLNF